VLQQLLDLLENLKIQYCLIGGLGVNAYVEPVISLDLDIVITAEALDKLITQASKEFKVEKFAHSYYLSKPKSDLRIQLQTDPRYKDFIPNSEYEKLWDIK